MSDIAAAMEKRDPLQDHFVSIIEPCIKVCRPEATGGEKKEKAAGNPEPIAAVDYVPYGFGTMERPALLMTTGGLDAAGLVIWSSVNSAIRISRALVRSKS